ncbi:hypothetical protein VTH06DRAFT_6447 [Thermothelomyces fergusii]
MERPSFIPRSSSSLTGLLSDREKSLLPHPVHQKPRIRALLGHCLYRRVILWTSAGLALLLLTLSSGKPGIRRERLLDLVHSKPDENGASHTPGEKGIKNDPEIVVVAAGSEISEETSPSNWREDVPHWSKYQLLDGFFVGLKALVPASEYKPEYPELPGEKSPYPLTISYTGLPTPTPYVPQPDYESPEYKAQHHPVRPCYLDKENKVPVPDIYAYDGIVQGQPEPVIGSHRLLGLRDDVCFDRFGRYGPYGLGYGPEEGGVGVGLDTERAGSEAVWARTGKINYDNIDWGEAQDRCYESNKERFADAGAQTRSSRDTSTTNAERSSGSSGGTQKKKKRIPRTAVVVRAYTGFRWTHHAVLNFRAMISELALRSGGEYTVHFLLHVRDDSEAVWADPETAQRVLDDNVPAEFHSVCTLWSEQQMRLIYPGKFGRSFSNPSGGDIHGVYRSAHMALQYFAMNHPEYEHFWNWELDMRWLGNYYELFDRLGTWARQQSRVGAWERSAKYYIPRYHGDWANFTALVRNETLASGRSPVLGPVSFAGRARLRAEEAGQNFVPPSCTRRGRRAGPGCGVGEEADLITLNPIFDVDESGWVFASDVTGYDTAAPPPPRRCAIVTASRLSRRLLAAMHEETWRLRHAMFSEMFPASVALHRGLKAVYAPHPVSLDRRWALAAVDGAFNGGRDRSADGRGSPFARRNEHNHKGATWYYHSDFAGLLWRRWLGYAQRDGRGGKLEEERPAGSGRMCLRSMLVHPIKWEHPSELEGRQP